MYLESYTNSIESMFSMMSVKILENFDNDRDMLLLALGDAAAPKENECHVRTRLTDHYREPFGLGGDAGDGLRP